MFLCRANPMRPGIHIARATTKRGRLLRSWSHTFVGAIRPPPASWMAVPQRRRRRRRRRRVRSSYHFSRSLPDPTWHIGRPRHGPLTNASVTHIDPTCISSVSSRCIALIITATFCVKKKLEKKNPFLPFFPSFLPLISFFLFHSHFWVSVKNRLYCYSEIRKKNFIKSGNFCKIK